MQSSVMHPAILSYLIETVCYKIHSLGHCGRRLNRGAVVSRSFSSFRQVILLKDMATLERTEHSPGRNEIGRWSESSWPDRVLHYLWHCDRKTWP